jgi:hypothetical protein
MTFPRQPDKLVVTPSNQSPWVGYIDEDDRFTRAQRAAMSMRNIVVSDLLFVVTVFREATTREMWWASTAAPPVFQFDCPVLQVLGDGRLKVIAPSGDVKIVLANGWVRTPSRRNRHLLQAKAA